MFNILLSKPKYIILSVFFTTLLIFSVSKIESILVGISIFILYLIYFGSQAGRFFIPQENKIFRIIFGSVAILSLLSISLTTIYWFYAFNTQILYIILIALPFIIGLQKPSETEDNFSIDLESYTYIKSYLGTKFFLIVATFLDLLLFWILWVRQSTDTLISPWTILGPRFFITFFISSVIIFWVLQKSKHTASNIFITILHFTLILSIALIIFRLGYGFDPFIHQAAEKWIAEYGTITPKTPYYIGQYMLTDALSLITHLRIDIVDRLLVPIGSAILVPIFLFFSFSRTGSKEKIFPAIMFLPFINLVFLNNTSPNNLAILLSILLVAWIWYERQNHNIFTRIFGFLLATATITIHPFIGLPILLVYVGSIVLNKINKIQTIFYFIYSPLLIAILPISFYLNSLVQKQKFLLENPLNNLTNFLLIFERPFYYWMDKGNIFYKSLYYFHDLMKPIFIIICLIGLALCFTKYSKKFTTFFALSSISLFISAFLLSTSLRFPGVIEYEQNVYAHRVLELAQILIIPFFIIAMREFFLFFRQQNKKQLTISIALAILLTISLYFTYPTRDQISRYTGYNLRQADLNAINFIHNRNNHQFDYIVLTTQSVATGALREFGFNKYLPTAEGEQYFYSIPTGGPLYQYFRKMVYEEPKRQWMEEAMRFTGVKKAYFIHTNYWAPAAELRDKAKLEADAWWEVDGGKAWVYEYKL